MSTLVECSRNYFRTSHSQMNWKDFFEMGGYGFYVWSAYGLMLLVLILNLYGSLKKDEAIKKKLTSQLIEGKRK